MQRRVLYVCYRLHKGRHYTNQNIEENARNEGKHKAKDCQYLLCVPLAHADDGQDEGGDAQNQRKNQEYHGEYNGEGIGIKHERCEDHEDHRNQAEHKSGSADAVASFPGGSRLLIDRLLVDGLLINRRLVNRLRRLNGLLVDRLCRLLINGLLRLHRLRGLLRKRRAAVGAEGSTGVINGAVAIWALNHCHSNIPLLFRLEATSLYIYSTGLQKRCQEKMKKIPVFFR